MTVPPLKDDCFALPPGVEWTPVEQALDMLRGRLGAVTGVEVLPLAQAAGRVLAAAPTALRAHPPAANSAVDGYGIAHAALSGETHDLPLVEGRSAAGAPYAGAVPAGHAIRILTGAILPQGVDCVVMQEDCTVEHGRLRFRRGLKPRANTRPAGEDVQAGAQVLAAGTRLGPPEIATLTAAGIAEVAVRRSLRVAVLSTGDELADPGEDAPVGKTYDANRPMLRAILARWGYEVVDLGRAPDLRGEVAARLDRGATEADAILTSGGASAGDEDHVSALLGERGALSLWRIAIKPGRPLALGVWGGKPVFGLPGNPVAAFVTALLFARPALSVLAGGPWMIPQGFDVPAAFAKSKMAGRREFLRGRIRDGRAEAFASEGSGRVSGLAWAEGLIDLPEAAMTVEVGTPVRFIPYGSFGL